MSKEFCIQKQDNLVIDNQEYKESKKPIKLETQKVTFFGIL
jgi:hypothetical protein